jgi:hypothetical protein
MKRSGTSGLGGYAAAKRANRPLQPSSEIRAVLATMRGGREVGSRFARVRYVVQVSAPAYSPDHQRALVYRESLCDGRCGGGSLLLAERKAGQWVIARALINWVG